VALVGGSYYLDTRKQLQELKQAEAAEGEFSQTFEARQRKGANLDLYKRAQLEEMRRTFGVSFDNWQAKPRFQSDRGYIPDWARQ
jgi:Tfp pilus assembly protein PilO